MDFNFLKGLGGPPAPVNKPSVNGPSSPIPSIQNSPVPGPANGPQSDTFVRTSGIPLEGPGKDSSIASTVVSQVGQKSLSQVKEEINPSTFNMLVENAKDKSREFPPIEGEVNS